jgi:hypothetical protein
VLKVTGADRARGAQTLPVETGVVDLRLGRWYSHHVRKLVDAGTVAVELRHTWAYYSISQKALKELITWLS